MKTVHPDMIRMIRKYSMDDCSRNVTEFNSSNKQIGEEVSKKW